MRISEIYCSKQGEGRLTGQQSVFIRTSGCNLRCSFCDTPFTSWHPEGDFLDPDEIVERAGKYDIRHVVVTGGEPMLSQEIELLTQHLKNDGFHITIETAGTIDRDVECDLMSISPKMSNSTPSVERAGSWSRKHDQTRLRPDVVRRLIRDYDFQLKFVIRDQTDVPEIESFCDSVDLKESAKVLLMPEGVSVDVLLEREAWVEEICRKTGFTFCPRMHIHWYGNKRGT